MDFWTTYRIIKFDGEYLSNNKFYMYKILKAKKSEFLFVSNLLTELFSWLSKFSKHTFDIKNEISYEEYINNLNDFYVLKNQYILSKFLDYF